MAETNLKEKLELLYTGRSRRAVLFRYALIAFDIFTIAFFIVTIPMAPSTKIFLIDVAVGLLIFGDFMARLWIAPNKVRMLRQIYTIADVFVILSLLLAPIFSQSFAFLRILRALRLLHSYHVLRDLRSETPFFRRNEDVILGAVNLGVFVFFVTSLVFVLQFGANPGIEDFIAALYFTVSALTTTGFGDIVLTGTTGRLLAIVIMIVGVALFLQLAQAIFRPRKVSYTCPSCGLNRHEEDAVHCKHCGEPLKIETEGSN
ncbi:potassium channel family protein [Nisaea sp.]|uniref:potassium channel family protein n=1 Tax=Nisaea sp. TaxID=2024842 RepID=UPI002B2754D1|nr:potassium channel family protein [Nisaea sp.]